jgi:hypothetical protein
MVLTFPETSQSNLFPIFAVENSSGGKMRFARGSSPWNSISNGGFCPISMKGRVSEPP